MPMVIVVFSQLLTVLRAQMLHLILDVGQVRMIDLTIIRTIMSKYQVKDQMSLQK